MTVQLRPSFHGSGGPLFGIYLKTLLLSIVTLGIYSFWGKTAVRAYVYGQTALGTDRFSYHGTGSELFKGWLKAMALALGIGVAATMLGYTVDLNLGALLFYLALMFGLFPLALLGSRAYRLSRTSWRGIRFSFEGAWGEFVGPYIRDVLLTAVTLGIYYPVFHVNVRRYLVDRSAFGTGRFEFTGSGGELVGRWVLTMILTPLTLGIYWFWWAAYRDKWYWEHTHLGAARFQYDVTGGELFGLHFVNGLLMMCTLGIAFPWVRIRVIEFHAQRLSIVDTQDLDQIRQDAQPAGTTGEGLADLMDVDMMGADFFGL